MFAWTTKELNPEQEAAVRLDDSLFLVACPGSGKTRTLTYKLAYELSRLQSGREYVVAITYTHRAADEIRERIGDLGVDTSQLWIGTIHSFCLEWILRPYGIYEPDLESGFGVIDQHEREKLLERICQPYRSPRITFWDCDYYFKDHGYVLGCQDPRKHKDVERVLVDFFAELRATRKIDFELILFYAHRLVTNQPQISKILSNMFKYVLVDEYQDTKQIQYSIVGSILRAGAGNTRLFMVGDPNQAIYGSLGGYPIELPELKALCNQNIEYRELSGNYRSSERVIDYFGNFNVHQTTISAVGPLKTYASLVSFNSTIGHLDLAAEIVRLIRHNVEDLGIAPREICVLAPQWFHLAKMTRWLVSSMPEYEFDGPGMVPFARDIENFWYKAARLALTKPSPESYIRRLRWAKEVLNELEKCGISVDKISAKALLRECNSVSLTEADGLSYLRQFFDELFARLAIPYQDFAELSEHHQAFFESSRSRIERLQGEGLENVSGVEFFRRIFQNRGGVTVSTIHGVKGAEFDVVIAYGLLEGMVPHFNDPEKDVSAQKLLYVVGSRARKHLHLFSETGRVRGGRCGDYQPTSRLAACQFDYNTL